VSGVGLEGGRGKRGGEKQGKKEGGILPYVQEARLGEETSKSMRAAERGGHSELEKTSLRLWKEQKGLEHCVQSWALSLKEIRTTGHRERGWLSGKQSVWEGRERRGKRAVCNCGGGGILRLQGEASRLSDLGGQVYFRKGINLLGSKRKES